MRLDVELFQNLQHANAKDNAGGAADADNQALLILCLVRLAHASLPLGRDDRLGLRQQSGNRRFVE